VNHGTEVIMSVGSQQRSFVMFDISSIPAGATVSAASLTLCRTNGSGGARTHELRAATSAWSESGVTWNTQPSLAGSSGATISVPSSAGCVTTDVKNDVQAWILAAPNFGWRIADIAELTAPLVDWATHEEPSTGLRPSLSVTYTP
jgi:hypothetical protein